MCSYETAACRAGGGRATAAYYATRLPQSATIVAMLGEQRLNLSRIAEIGDALTLLDIFIPTTRSPSGAPCMPRRNDPVLPPSGLSATPSYVVLSLLTCHLSPSVLFPTAFLAVRAEGGGAIPLRTFCS